MRILYVENHPVFATNVTHKFLANHSVTVVPSLSAACQALATLSFNLLLIDYDLDDRKGDALVREVRASGQRILTIGVSSHEEGNAALKRAGADATCSKMNFDQIQSIIESLQRSPQKVTKNSTEP